MRRHIRINNKTGEQSCSRFKLCGGCQLAMSYMEQLEWKQQKADRLLSRFCKVEPIVGSEDPYNYRNKVQTVFAYDSHERLLSGVYQSGSGRCVATEDCMLEDKICQKAAIEFKRLMQSFKLKPYNAQTGKGYVRHLLTRYSRSTGQLLVCLCAVDSTLPYGKALAEELKKACPKLTSFVLNVSNKPLPLSLGDRNIVLYGSGYIEDEIMGRRFRVSPQSFYQVNSSQTEKLYRQVIEYAAPAGNETLIDAYCGTGTIGILCADKAGKVIGTELNKSAADDALYNIRLNGLENVTVVNEDAGVFMSGLASSGEKADIVIVDPPRAGCDRKFLESLAELAPERAVYVSCKISSLVRDLRYLMRLGYKAVKIQPIDMFPHTTGIETVVLLNKRSGEPQKAHLKIHLKKPELKRPFRKRAK